MKVRFFLKASFLTILLAAAPPSLAAAPGSETATRGVTLTVVSVEPVPQELAAPVDGGITVRFDRPVDRASFVARRTFWAFGRWSGTVEGSFVFSDGDQAVTLMPSRDLSAGESVMVMLSHDLAGADGSGLRAGGYSFRFWTRAAPAGRDLEEIDRLTTRTTPGSSSRAYGGVAADLDRDGYPDVTIVNEDTSDLRTFLNSGDGSGIVAPFLQPTSPVGSVPSPSETGDFDSDGEIDVAVANVFGNSVSILLGQGDGTFAPQQEVAIGVRPRGIAVLDADGDGDLDVAATSNSDSRLWLLVNDGAGAFTAAPSFGSGSDGEWALGAADMDEDGIFDLVVGAQNVQEAQVYRGHGDGTFSFLSARSCGGNPWMVSLGDLDGDGHEDVAIANSSSDNGAVLMGDGAGQLAAPRISATDPFPLATDLGDLDGDGDLDWVLSSFQGDWGVYVNDGAGAFTFNQEVDAPQAASCALLADLDRDGDLDLVLVDELEDVVVLMRNTGLFADPFESGNTSAWTATIGGG